MPNLRPSLLYCRELLASIRFRQAMPDSCFGSIAIQSGTLLPTHP